MTMLKKIFAIAFCLMVIMSILLSVSFVSHEATHECVGEDCQICAAVSKCAEVLEKLLAVATFVSLFGLVVYTTGCADFSVGASWVVFTPVKLKVKLSN